MAYFVTILACSLLVVMVVSARNQRRPRFDEDLHGIIQLLLPVNVERMQELFDPAEEWSLRAKNSPEAFKMVQRNRRKLAIQFASHMYRNAGLLQRLGRAGMRRRGDSHAVTGKLLVDAGVAVRMRSFLLLFFLRLQQVLYTGSNLSAVKDAAVDLLPEYDEMLRVAFNLSKVIDPRLHQDFMGAL
jgi:hypothetical protein